MSFFKYREPRPEDYSTTKAFMDAYTAWERAVDEWADDYVDECYSNL